MYKMKTILLLILILGLSSASYNNTGTISNIFFSLKYFHSNPGPCRLPPPSQRGDVHWVLLQHTVTHHKGASQRETTEPQQLHSWSDSYFEEETQGTPRIFFQKKTLKSSQRKSFSKFKNLQFKLNV